MGVSDAYKEEMIKTGNDFLNFDAVLEIEKKKSYNEHDKQIRADAIEEYTEWLRKSHANFDEDYAEDIKSDYLEWLKERTNE